MTVDGLRNAVDEVEAQRVPVSADNPHGNAFRRARTRLSSESSAQRLADNSTGRVWHIVNPDVRNRYGNPVGYALYPEGPAGVAGRRVLVHPGQGHLRHPAPVGGPATTRRSATRPATSSTRTRR